MRRCEDRVRAGSAPAPRSVRDAPDEVRALAEWVTQGDRLVVVDQLYCRQLFAGADFTHLGSLRAIPDVTVASPLGSSYVFPEASADEWGRGRGDALAIALKAAGVLINPGYQFGRGHAARFRINFSQDAGRLSLAVDRIAAVLAR